MKLLLFGWGRVGCFRLNFDDLSFLPDIFVQGLVKRMGGERGGVSQNNEFHAGSGDGQRSFGAGHSGIRCFPRCLPVRD